VAAGALTRSTAGGYGRSVADRDPQPTRQASEIRHLVLPLAVAVALIAALTDPSSAADLLVGAVAVAAFALWAYAPGVPLWALSAAVIAPVAVAQHSGQLEPLMFEVSLLAFVIGRWASPLGYAIGLGVLAVAAPVATSVIQDPSEIAVGIWMIGIALPWVLGRAAAQQGRLAAELYATRRELARQAVLAERRDIGRDVHDLVGHGLAAVLLQVTSARHVLRRDPASAEEALLEAEAIGRRSMADLRRTIGVLRSDEVEVAPPVPSAREIPTLVEEARATGLAVELHVSGDLAPIAQSVGAALYRVAQESLANAVRHAPQAQTVLQLEVADGQVSLVAETTGPLEAATGDPPERPRYGLIGMRERVSALGGEFAAGPTVDGWRVSCRLPAGAPDRLQPEERGSS
jgi:signal transduction histidine kinase